MSSPNGNESTPPRSPRYDGAVPGFSKLDVAGFILAFVLPPVGFVVGLTLVKRPERQLARHGRWIVVISLVVGVLYVLALIATAHVLGTSEAE